MISAAVVLARGLGSRMRSASDVRLTAEQAAAAANGHKALMPIGAHRLIDHSLSALADAGIRRAVLVVAPDHGDFVAHRDALGSERLRIEFAVQDEPRGTAHALACARDVVGDESFLMVNGDNVYPVEAMRELLAQDCDAVLGFDREALIAGSNIPAERINAFALLSERDGILADIIEKPAPEVVAAHGGHALVSMNCFAFTPRIFDACERVELSPRGEYEIVDAVRMLDGVRVIPVEGGVVDLSRRDDIAAVEAMLADRPVRL